MSDKPISENDQAWLSQSDIERCVHILELLASDTNQIFDIPGDFRLELIKAAGRFSSPTKEDFYRRKKEAKKALKKKQFK